MRCSFLFDAFNRPGAPARAGAAYGRGVGTHPPSRSFAFAGAGRAARALITSALARSEGTPLLVVVPTLEEAGRWAALLELMGWPTTQLYPTSEGSPMKDLIPPVKSLGASYRF